MKAIPSHEGKSCTQKVSEEDGAYPGVNIHNMHNNNLLFTCTYRRCTLGIYVYVHKAELKQCGSTVYIV